MRREKRKDNEIEKEKKKKRSFDHFPLVYLYVNVVMSVRSQSVS
jgi:hypothetical protein